MRIEATQDLHATIAAVFWETFSAGNAITALLETEFCEEDLYAVGALTGPPPDVSPLLRSTGMPPRDFAYYNDCFQEGAILLLVRATSPRERRTAVDVLSRHGATFSHSLEA
jgi:hypothetical protein